MKENEFKCPFNGVFLKKKNESTYSRGFELSRTVYSRFYGFSFVFIDIFGFLASLLSTPNRTTRANSILLYKLYAKRQGNSKEKGIRDTGHLLKKCIKRKAL